MLLVCATPFAQLNVNLGYAQSTDRYKAGNNLYSMRLNGFTVGLGYSVELADGLLFTPGVNYLFAGPTASIGIASNTKLIVNVGPYKADEVVDNYKGNDYYRFDILLGGGIGLRIADSSLFKVGYDFGMLNRSGVKDVTDRRRLLTVGLSYLFD